MEVSLREWLSRRRAICSGKTDRNCQAMSSWLQTETKTELFEVIFEFNSFWHRHESNQTKSAFGLLQEKTANKKLVIDQTSISQNDPSIRLLTSERLDDVLVISEITEQSCDKCRECDDRVSVSCNIDTWQLVLSLFLPVTFFSFVFPEEQMNLWFKEHTLISLAPGSPWESPWFKEHSLILFA